MPKKIDIDYINNRIKNRGLNLLSKEYIDSKSLLLIECPNGHTFESRWKTLSQGTGCPICNNNKNKISINHIKNYLSDRGYTLLSDLYINNKTKLKIRCHKNHVFETTWNSITHGYSCPECALDNKRKSLYNIERSLNEIGYSLIECVGNYKNARSTLIVKCSENHIYKTNWDAFNSGIRCTECSKINRRKHSHDDVKSFINKTGHTLLSKSYTCVTDNIYVKCPNDHIYSTSFSRFKNGGRCKKCSNNDRRLQYEDVKSFIDREGYTLLSTNYHNSHSYLTIKCDKGHVYNVRYYNFYQGYRCPICNKNGTSKQELYLIEFIKSICKDKIKISDRSIIKPKELDITIPSKKIAIEYCGLYWHSELMGKDRKYHLNKLEGCEKAGYNLITVFEDEWLYKREIVESRLKIILEAQTIKTRLFARNCTVGIVDTKDSRIFCENNHLQGYGGGASVKIGLRYNNVLVALMTFSKPSISKGYSGYDEGVWELHRFCCLKDTIVVGAASKLLSFFKKNNKWKKIFSYADRRWSVGKLYETIGFRFDGFTDPNYWYVSRCKRIHRFALRKKPDEPKDITEWELRKKEGYNRIWDCGNMKYIMYNKEI